MTTGTEIHLSRRDAAGYWDDLPVLSVHWPLSAIDPADYAKPGRYNRRAGHMEGETVVRKLVEVSYDRDEEGRYRRRVRRTVEI